jgi:diguanylate cyclase (GGDEF)-like protein/PAS domain S-box-containing protein
MTKTDKQNKSRMVESAKLAQALIRCPGLGIYIVQDGKFQYANSMFQELTGYTEQELRGIYSLDLVHPEDREAVREKAIENLKGNLVLPYEYRFIKKNGEEMWISERLASIRYRGKRAAVGSFVDITERKQAEEALRRSEQNFRDSIENSPLGIRVLDKDGKTVFANRALLDIWGYSSIEEAEAVPREQLFTPQSYVERMERLEKRKRGEHGPLNYEVSIVRSDGQVRILSASRGELLWNCERRFQIVYQDITERKKAEEALADEATRRRVLIDHSRDGIFVLDENGKVYEANQRFDEMLGYSPEGVLQLHMWDFDAQRTREELLKMARDVDDTGNHLESRLRRKDGTVFDVEISASGAIYAGHKLSFCVCRDITERKQLEEALAKSEERYRTVLEQMEEAYYETDIAGKFTFFNDAMCRQLGYSGEELMGMSFKVLTPPEDVKRVFGLYNQVYCTDEPFTSVPMGRIRKDGTRLSAETSAFPLRNGSGEIIGFRGIIRDVTEHKQFEQKLAEMATHDALTGLPNRILLSDRFTVALALSRRSRNRLAVLMLDLDRFKAVNDSMGHDVGDQLLKAAGKRLKVPMRKSDTVARIGGDEFVVLLPQIPHADEAAKVAQRILEAFREPFVFDGHRLYITTSIGIAVYPEGGEDIESLLKNADIAMYGAKEQGRDAYRFYDGSEAVTLLAKQVRA